MTLRHRLWSLLAMALVLLSIGVVSSAGAAELTRQASASGAAASYTYDGPRQHARTAITPRDAPRRGSDPPVMARLMPRKQLTSGFAAEARTLDIGGGSFPGQDVKSIIRTPDGVISVNPNAAHGPTVVGRSQQLPFADNSFTSVTMNHFPADQLGDGTLSEVARVLRSGGDLSLTTGRVADTGAIIDELERLGFATTLGRAEGGIPWITGVLG